MSVSVSFAFTVTGAANEEDDGKYYVYYVSAEDTKNAKYPKGSAIVSVSGDGSAGFIVTARAVAN